jgi:hypothetical protein
MGETFDGAADPQDFSFVVKMRGGPEKPWIWEVHCAGKGKPLERSSVFYKIIRVRRRQRERGKKPWHVS